jgi:undecaprenyl phosphate-alpha-L-ara4N flippase subunit ArnE
VTLPAIILCIACQFFLVGGQLFLKHAMRDTAEPRPKWTLAKGLSLGIFLQSLWFFVWVNLLKDNKLSHIFPFEGLNPVLLVLAAWLFLKERMTIDSWVGILLICAGIFLVSSS